MVGWAGFDACYGADTLESRNDLLLVLVVKSVSIATSLLLDVDQWTVDIKETLLQLAYVDGTELNNIFEN